MSITSDIRNYADTAIEQGKQFAGAATATANDLRADLQARAEKTLNFDAIKTAVEPYLTPYLTQAKQYRSTVTDRAEGLLGTVKSDKRVASVLATAETLSGVVVDTVQERVIKPVQSLTGRTPARKPARKSAAPKPVKAATTRPAKKAPAKKATTAKSTTRKAPAKKATTSS